MAPRSIHQQQRGEQQEQIQIVDPVLRQGFAQLPRLVLRAKGLSDKAKVVYALLLDYAWQQGSCFPGQHRLAQDLSTTERTIRRALDELRRFKLIDWKRRGLSQTNVYYILSLASHAGVADTEADRTFLSAQKRTPMSDQKRTGLSDKEDAEEPDEDVNLRNSKGNAAETEVPGTKAWTKPPRAPDQSVTQLITSDRSRTKERSRASGFRSIAATLRTPHPALARHQRPGSTGNSGNISAQLAVCITEISQDFDDARHLRSNLTRALRVQERSRLLDGAFVIRLYEARAITRDRQVSRGGGSDQPIAKPMAYFWQVLEDLLGLHHSEAIVAPDRVHVPVGQGRSARWSDGQEDG